ncbi:MAG: M20/M25/M40 family metallo-hydrolase [Rhizobacter sp.]|nr:M20/M25/M40 family metallo-hydrolase [Rhizobacter sp.]
MHTITARFLDALAAAAAALALAQPAGAAPSEPQWFAAAQAAEPAVIASLHDMVAIESGSTNAAGLAQMADYVERRLRDLGARTERIAGAGGHGTLVRGTFAGTGTKKLMLIAHMDTVYPEGTLATQPYHRDGNKLYGPGIADDKGGIAVVLHALAILKDAGWRDYAQLTVLFNQDEEIGSTGSGETIARLASEHDVVFSCEPTSAKAVTRNEGLLLGAAGAGVVTMEVAGRSAHAGAAPELGRNALIELAYQLQQTRDVAKSIPGVQLNWTRAQAGVVDNQIPEKATARGDVRITAPGAAEKLMTALQEKVGAAHLVPDTQTTLSMQIGRPPYVANERSRAFAKQAQAIYGELDGRELTLVAMVGAATDAGYAAQSGRPIVIESFGLAGAGYHARDEYIEVDSIAPRLYLMMRMLQSAARLP